MPENMQSQGSQGLPEQDTRVIMLTWPQSQVMAFFFFFLKQGLDVWMAQMHMIGVALGAGDKPAGSWLGWSAPGRPHR